MQQTPNNHRFGENFRPLARMSKRLIFLYRRDGKNLLSPVSYGSGLENIS
jgi:hypothetical protein